MTLNFEDEYPLELPFKSKEVAERVAKHSLEYENCPYEAEVNLLLTSDEEIRRMNSQFRQIDRATDVLSFPLIHYRVPADFSEAEENEAECFHPETGELMLGDIVISKDKVLEQAKAYGHSPQREFAFLVAHSMLHLMGYDHVKPEEAQQMERRQAEILEQLEIKR